MVPVQEFNRLKGFYKGQVTKNALLDKAGRLAAEEHFILKDRHIPDSMAVKIAKPLSSEQGRLVKRIHTGKTGPLTYEGTKEPEGMVDAPMETLLKQIITKEHAGPIVIETGPSTSGIKIEPSTSGIRKEKNVPRLPFHQNRRPVGVEVGKKSPHLEPPRVL